ncbi:phospholipase D family protein [Variovorax sp. RA8]|uniref:phospholipase D family protein n=1 Tax=Variovorax sp. (strain JCM 16519 / RA8) TaxID=662548 RepID=UPI001316F109|nr:phospholipase D family protein [Variovorax sp. RA8]VTU24913.1 Major cardiolipin synthase ClsA [Variovorax sp. RA8]
MRPLRAFLALSLALVLAACATLPATVQRAPSSAFTSTDDTLLGRALAPELMAHPGLTGILPLIDAGEAFAARMALAQAAERSLDMQYYIWRGDTTGQLLLEAAWAAAERGVRVRLLLDDNNTSGLDGTLAVLDAHPKLEVRLFNPFANRSLRAGDFALDFSRVNRRMHNKSFTADNQVAIVGGRNVGDEYYGADQLLGFQDLDVVTVGPVVREVSRQFDLYWNSEAAYPVAALLGQPPPDATAQLRARWTGLREQPQTQLYLEAVRQTPLMREVAARRLPFEWADAHVVSDLPSKVQASDGRAQQLMFPLLRVAMGEPRRELDLVSPYFVPGAEGAQELAALARRGVAVRVLTNSLAATDVAAVHAGYARYRKGLLAAGVVLYELKPSAAPPPRPEEEKRRNPGGSSAASLHAKTFAVDRRRIFVGSLNLDPRSVHLNTEMGVVIDSPTLARRLGVEIDQAVPTLAYEVRLPQGGGMEWIDRGPDGETRYRSEPDTGGLRRLWVDFLSLLPIEWLL